MVKKICALRKSKSMMMMHRMTVISMMGVVMSGDMSVRKFHFSKLCI